MISKTHRSYSGVKKIVFKPFTSQPSSSNEVNENDITTLINFVSSVYLKKNEENFSKEELYQLVEEICIKKSEEVLLARLKVELNKFINEKVQKLLQHSSSPNFFDIVNDIWLDHVEQLNTIRNVFLYLDRTCITHVKERSSTSSIIWELGNFIFRDSLRNNTDLIKIIVQKLLEKIEEVRTGQLLSVESISRVTNMLQTLNIYSTFFEPLFLSTSSQFFAKEGLLLLNLTPESSSAVDTCTFLAHVDRRLMELDGPLCEYLYPLSRHPLSNVILENLLKPHVEILLRDGFSDMMKERKIEDLGKLFLLYDKVNSLSLLKTYWGNFINSEGEKIINKFKALPLQTENSSSTVIMEEIIELHDHLEKILSLSFYSDEKFKTTLKSSFERFLNFDSKISAEQLVKFIDKYLKLSNNALASKNFQTGTENSSYIQYILDENDTKTLDLFLNKIIIIFRYLTEKDFFELFYKKYLADRLLNNKTINLINAEKSILIKLRVECGSNYTSKLDGMFTDIELSKICQTSFQEHLETLQAEEEQSNTKIIEINKDENIVITPHSIANCMSVKVLSSGFWPTPSSFAFINLPPELVFMKEKFEQFYEKNFQGRKIQWIPSYDRCLVSAHFPNGRKDLDVTLHQSVVLRAFNSNDALTFGEIQQMTSFELDELKLLLISLTSGKEGTRVLLHNSPAASLTPQEQFKSITSQDTFVFNKSFSNNYLHIKIPMINFNSNTEEVQTNTSEIFKEREYQVDASIVSIMKSKKVLTHNLLVQEISARLRFSCSINDIKTRIESLIEREFLQRDPIDNNLYHYLA